MQTVFPYFPEAWILIQYIMGFLYYHMRMHIFSHKPHRIPNELPIGTELNMPPEVKPFISLSYNGS